MTRPYLLVVDDDPEIRAALVDILTDEGFQVAAVADGREALAWLRTRPGQVSLILLDLMMPGMDGRSFLTERTADSQLAPIPVVVFSAETERGIEEVVRSFEIAGTLRKPVRIPTLLSAIRAALRPSI